MITSTRNARVQLARRLTKRGVRDARLEFIIEGGLGIGQAIAVGAPLKLLLVSAPEQFRDLTAAAARIGLRVVEVSDQVMRSVSSASTPPGVLAVSRFVDRDPVAVLRPGVDLAVVMSGVRDPGNAGTIIRSAAGVGADAVFLGGETVDLYNPKVVRATAGALFNVPICRNVDIPWLLAEFAKRGIRTIGADPTGPTIYHDADLAGPMALVLGNEAHGVPPEVLAGVDCAVRIPMQHGVESLNVGMAASVMLFESARQRRAAESQP